MSKDDRPLLMGIAALTLLGLILVAFASCDTARRESINARTIAACAERDMTAVLLDRQRLMTCVRIAN